MTTVRAPRRRKARIEIIPLIDVMFFLLATFIMVSLSMTRNTGMQVALPSASTAEKQPSRDDSVTLTVSKDPKVVVSGAADANFKVVVAVLDEARKIGIQKVGISTQKK